MGAANDLFRFFLQKVLFTWRSVKGLRTVVGHGLAQDSRRRLSVSIREQNFRNAFHCRSSTYIFVSYS